MDFIQHGLWASWWFRKRLWLAIVLFFLGALPDFIGFAEKLARWDWGVWNWYNVAHEITWWEIAVLPYGLHILMDAVIHPFDQYVWLWWMAESLGRFILLYIIIKQSLRG